MNKLQLIDTLKEYKKSLEEKGYIPTLELLIERLEVEQDALRMVNEEKL
jgi:hypothetical protein